jgi:exonuclease I
MVAPMSLLNEQVEARIGWIVCAVSSIGRYYCRSYNTFARSLSDVFSQPYEPPVRDAEFLIYDGFFNEQDKREQQAVRRATEQELATRNFVFSDQRLSRVIVSLPCA